MHSIKYKHSTLYNQLKETNPIKRSNSDSKTQQFDYLGTTAQRMGSLLKIVHEACARMRKPHSLTRYAGYFRPWHRHRSSFYLDVRLKRFVDLVGIVYVARGATDEQRLDLGDDCGDSRPRGGAFSPTRLYHLIKPTPQSKRRFLYTLYTTKIITDLMLSLIKTG